jgi:hypothetical protein
VTPLATATDLGSGLVAAGLAELQTGALDPCP